MNEAELAAWKATWKKFQPVTHKCADCGTDVVQTDSDIPPWVMYGPGWLCTECKAKRDADTMRQQHAAGKAARAAEAAFEANDAWERGE